MKLPQHRLAHQRWVFLMFESPTNSWTNISQLNNVFDWTMTYRSDSDIAINYGRLIPSTEYSTIDLEENVPPTPLGYN
jgi:hypothetical protein